METKKNCPNCHKPLDEQAPQGLCPDCLLKAGWPTATEAEPSSEGFTPPSLETLAGLFPQLEIQELIGKGGMGAVFKARQPNLDRIVALKILPVKQGTDPGFAARFTREARALAKLNHRHIVAVHDFGQVEGFHYFVMEYVDGLNLRQVQQAGTLSPKEALGIIPQICEALQFAHDEGVVHRDIKPENVLLDQKGQIKIADFGLAKMLGAERKNFTLTEPNHVMGTPHYMAPEQVENPAEVDHRADIYSLGVVFYELLTGELPLGKFAAPSKKVQVDVRLDEVVLRALAKEPQLRYQQASQVKTEVETIASSPVQEASQSVEDDRLIAEAKQKLKGPAIGLIVAGILEWLVVPLGIAGVILLGGFRPGPTEVAVLLASLPLAGFIIFAGLKVKQVEAYLPGIIASVLAIIVTPANTIGLPVGIWALVVLTRKEIRAAFALRAKAPSSAPPSWWRAEPKALGATLIHAILLGLVGILFVFILPSEFEALSALDKELPRPILRIIGLVDFLQQYGLPLYFVVLGIDWAIVWCLSLYGGRRARWAWSICLVSILALLIGGILVNLVNIDKRFLHFAAPDRFGAVMKRQFIRPEKDAAKIYFLDLERNALVQPPFAVEMPEGVDQFRYLWDTYPELQQWLNDAGIDLVFAWQSRANGWGWRLMGAGAERLNPRRMERSFGAVKPMHLIERKTGALRVAGYQVEYGLCKTLCLRTDQGLPGKLRWKSLFDGVTDGVQIQYRLLDSPQAPQGIVHFGPTQEVTLCSIKENQAQDAMDLYTGKVVDYSESDYVSWSRAQRLKWLEDSGVDLMVSYQGQWSVIVANLQGFKLGRVGNDQWSQITASALHSALNNKQDGLESVPMGKSEETALWRIFLLPKDFEPPLTLAFSTLSGRQGLLRVVETGQTPRSLKLQYKWKQAVGDPTAQAGSLENNSSPSVLPIIEQESIVDFNDPAFWGRQIKRHLEAVRTLDAALETERQTFAKDQQVPERRYRYHVDLKWDRDNKWIDCSSEQIGGRRSANRIIQGPDVAWANRGDHDWTKLKAGSRHMALTQFSYFGEMRKNAYEHAFGVARGIICSNMLYLTQSQGAIDWAQVEFVLRVDGQGRHVLEKTQMIPGIDGEQVEVGMALIGQWEQGAFKLLELRGICQAYDVDLPYEHYSDHVFNQGAWVPRQVTENDWITPQPGSAKADATIRLREKRITTVKRLVVNRPMQAHEFAGFRPPAGSRVTDTVRDTHYTVWPDLEKIRAQAGKDRVAVKGRVYLDGRPIPGMTVATSTRYDPNHDIYKRVQAETDVDGRFELSGLVPGFSYRIKVEDEAGHTAETKVRLSDQGQDYEGLKIDMTSGLSVSGHVTGPDGEPIEHALVRFRGKSPIETDAQGRYTVNGLYADQGYEVEVGARGYAPLDPGGGVITDNFKIQLDPNGQPLPFDITLEKERILHGRVINQDEEPVEGVRVRVWSSPFGLGSTWKWYDTHTDPNGHFRVGNLGDRIYAYFMGQYGQQYHNPLESPVVIRVTGDSFMPAPLSGRGLVERPIREQAETFESRYRPFFRVKEYREASIKNQGGKLVSQWLEQLADANDGRQYELLAYLGSVPAYPAHDTLEQILCGRVLSSSIGAVTHFDSNSNSARAVGPCPAHLAASQDPTVICLAMRALARSGFVFAHAQLLIDKLDHTREQVRAYALVTLAEMTGVCQGADPSQWQRWVDQYRQYREDLDTRGNGRLLADVCRVARDRELTPESVERVMAAWQGSSAGALRFREVLGGQRGADLWRFLASIKLEGDKPIQYGHTRGYWRSDMFLSAGHHKHDVKVQFERRCTLDAKTFEPDQWYIIPALFRDGYQGKWEIVDLRFEDVEAAVGSQ